MSQTHIDKILCITAQAAQVNWIKKQLNNTKEAFIFASNIEQALNKINHTKGRLGAILLWLDWASENNWLKQISDALPIQDIPEIFLCSKQPQPILSHQPNHYFVPHPHDTTRVQSTIKAAINDYKRLLHLQEELLFVGHRSKQIKICEIEFKTLEDVEFYIPFLVSNCPDPVDTGYALTELMINAIEHGNLGIGYDEKSQLNETGTWRDEVYRRLSMKEYADKSASVFMKQDPRNIVFRIKDDGEGFDWNNFLTMDEKRLFDNHGRGIALAKQRGGMEMQYTGKGNEVYCTVILQPPKSQAEKSTTSV